MPTLPTHSPGQPGWDFSDVHLRPPEPKPVRANPEVDPDEADTDPEPGRPQKSRAKGPSDHNDRGDTSKAIQNMASEGPPPAKH